MSFSSSKVGIASGMGILPLVVSGMSGVNLVRALVLVGIDWRVKEAMKREAVCLLIVAFTAVECGVIDMLEMGFMMYHTVCNYEYKLPHSFVAVVVEILVWLIVNGLFSFKDQENAIFVLFITLYIIKESLYHHSSNKEQHRQMRCDQEILFLKQELNLLRKNEHNSSFMESHLYRRKTKLLIEKIKHVMNSKDFINDIPELSHSGNIELCIRKESKEEEFRRSNSDSLRRLGSRTEDSEEIDISKIISGDSIDLNSLSNSDLTYIMNCVAFREYLIFTHKNSNTNDIQVVNDEIKKIYTQTIGSSSGSQRLFHKSRKMKRMRTMMEVKEQLVDILEGVGEWDFDTLAISDHAQNPCFEVGYYVFTTLGLTELFDISNQKLRNFLTAVESGYNKNYYHNSFHAADVASSTVFLIINGLGFCGKVSDIDIFGLVVAALCHDIGHPGLNNSFLIARQDELAMLYNDKSVLENMHAYRTFQILKTKSCNIHSKLSQTDVKIFRKIVIESIIATDLSLHFTKIKQLREGLDDNKTLEDEAFKNIALQMTLKCADLGHGAKYVEIHKKWTELITKEFFKQGDTERELGMTVNSMFDREKVNISESQKGFITFLVKPLFDAYEEFVKHFTGDEDEDLKIEICSRNILENLEYWEHQSEQQTTIS